MRLREARTAPPRRTGAACGHGLLPTCQEESKEGLLTLGTRSLPFLLTVPSSCRVPKANSCVSQTLWCSQLWAQIRFHQLDSSRKSCNAAARCGRGRGGLGIFCSSAQLCWGSSSFLLPGWQAETGACAVKTFTLPRRPWAFGLSFPVLTSKTPTGSVFAWEPWVATRIQGGAIRARKRLNHAMHGGCFGSHSISPPLEGPEPEINQEAIHHTLVMELQ